MANLYQKISNHSPTSVFKSLMNLWPPFLGPGIKVLEISSDFRYIKVMLKRRWYNSNYVGTQYGGSMYSMTDPFYMLMLIKNLGRAYIVWDKAARIDFKSPGRTRLIAEFRISEDLLEEVRQRTKDGDKYIFDLPVDLKDDHGTTIATVIKTLYVRKKSSFKK